MKKCEYCGEKIGILETSWESTDKKIAMHNKCYEKYMNDSEIKKQILEEEEREKHRFDEEKRKQEIKEKLESKPSHEEIKQKITVLGVYLRISGVLSAIIIFFSVLITAAKVKFIKSAIAHCIFV